MSRQKSSKRKYDSTRRQEQARQTRLQIVEAARTLFIQYGYAGTTIDAIAKQAGISKITVYSIFKNKMNILALLLDVSISGDDQPIRLIDRPGTQAVLHDTDQKRQLRMIAQGMCEVLTRVAPVFEVMRAAAKTEPQIDSRMQTLQRERLENMTAIMRYVTANGPLRSGVDEARAGETVWALTSPELFSLFTTTMGWSAEKYSDWLADTLIRALLP